MLVGGECTLSSAAAVMLHAPKLENQMDLNNKRVHSPARSGHLVFGACPIGCLSVLKYDEGFCHATPVPPPFTGAQQAWLKE